LSNGEQFRCDLARALAGNLVNVGWPGTSNARTRNASPRVLTSFVPGHPEIISSLNLEFPTPNSPTVVFDEFTSVVDRNVARISSAAVAKALRSDHIPGRFVAVTCHYDVLEWLAPDWVLDMATRVVTRRSLRRPAIRLRIDRCRAAAWRMFERHHYLSGKLSPTARCYLASWNDTPVTFVAVIPLLGQRGHWRITRLVTLPGFQGIGIGMKVATAVAAAYAARGLRMNIAGSHPAVIGHCRRSPHWRTVSIRTPRKPGRHVDATYHLPNDRAVVSFEYVTTKLD